MAGMYEAFETDSKTEREGIWLNYGGFRVLIGRAGGSNRKYQKRLTTLSHPYRRAIATDTLDDQIAREIMAEAYADAVIHGWQVKVNDEGDAWHWEDGIEAKDGSIQPVNKQTIMATLLNLKDLFEDIQEQAKNIALFRVAAREEAAKNS